MTEFQACAIGRVTRRCYFTFVNTEAIITNSAALEKVFSDSRQCQRQRICDEPTEPNTIQYLLSSRRTQLETSWRTLWSVILPSGVGGDQKQLTKKKKEKGECWTDIHHLGENTSLNSGWYPLSSECVTAANSCPLKLFLVHVNILLTDCCSSHKIHFFCSFKVTLHKI